MPGRSTASLKLPGCVAQGLPGEGAAAATGRGMGDSARANAQTSRIETGKRRIASTPAECLSSVPVCAARRKTGGLRLSRRSHIIGPMAETTTPFDIRARRGAAALGTVVVWVLAAALALVVAAELVFFGIHAAHLLTYPYPLDYGEGPLLAQVSLLRAGTPIWRLYSDPGAPPYAVVNYPPVYHLLAALVALPLGDYAGATLLAGRLVSLAATFAAVLALWLLSDDGTGTIYPASTADDRRIMASPVISGRWSVVARMLIVL